MVVSTSLNPFTLLHSLGSLAQGGKQKTYPRSHPCQPWVSPRYLSLLPDAPAWDAHGLDDADDQLGHEGEEECHEAEGTVSPATEEKALITWAEGQGFTAFKAPRPFQV